jgi:hypothetical protein
VALLEGVHDLFATCMEVLALVLSRGWKRESAYLCCPRGVNEDACWARDGVGRVVVV